MIPKLKMCLTGSVFPDFSLKLRQENGKEILTQGSSLQPGESRIPGWSDSTKLQKFR